MIPGMLIRRAAMTWYHAEVHAGRLPEKMTDGDIYAVAVPRVIDVFAGEVRRSECTPGDLAIWKGRPRVPPEVAMMHTSTWDNVYDTVDLTHGGTYRLFGCENVGNLFRTNLQVAGQIAGCASFTIHQMYADLGRDLSIHDRVIAELCIGQNLIWNGHIRDMFAGVPVGVVVPPRQNFYVRVYVSDLTEPLEMVVHLEGDVSRTVY